MRRDHNKVFRKQRSLQAYCLGLLMVLLVCTVTGNAQTSAGSQIVNQGQIVYRYKNFPVDSLKTNFVNFTVLNAPNFDISFEQPSQNVFSKETVIVKIIYKNIGNTKADSANIQGILPSGLRFVPGSTGGKISGNSVTWKVFNKDVGATDTVRVKTVVDSTLANGSQLRVDANISWESFQTNTSVNFTINNFARLSLSMQPLKNLVGSGRPMAYRLTFKNTGNIPATNVVLSDTISLLGTYQSATIPPAVISANKKLVQWNISSFNANSETSIDLVVATEPNLTFSVLTNSLTLRASNDTTVLYSVITTPIAPVVPKAISTVPEIKFIFGQENKDSTNIVVAVFDSLNLPIPDGVPVAFSTTRGTFPNGTPTITALIKDGKASTFIRAATVNNVMETATIQAVAGVALTGTINGSCEVIMYPGAVTGAVINGLNHIPLKGAIAKVSNQLQEIVGADTTKENGVFFVPLNKSVTIYFLEIFIVDQFGDTIVSRSEFNPTTILKKGGIVIPNVIAGRLQFKHNNQPIPAENITIYLDSIAQTPLAPRSNRKQKVTDGIIYSRVQEQKTDKKGKFKFEGLKPAAYRLSIDSVNFPAYSGFRVVLDTSNGTFTFNLSIDVLADSLVNLTMTGNSIVFAGDSIQYQIKLQNTGNLVHSNIVIRDTLPNFVTISNVTKGNFTSVDTAKNIITWLRDTLKVNGKDSLSLSVKLSRNISDSTRLENSVWYTSSMIQGKFQRSTTTLIRSAGALVFRHSFVDTIRKKVAGDSIPVRFWYSNSGTDTIKSVSIVDTIFSNAKNKISFNKFTADSIRVDTIFTVPIASIAPGDSGVITRKLFTDFTILKNAIIISSAHIIWKDTSRGNVRDTLFLIENPNLSNFLKVVKTANKKVVEIGDIITYQISISNNSPSKIYTIGVHDFIPYAFTYIKKSARFDGKIVEPILTTTAPNKLIWSVKDTLGAGKTIQLVYQLAIGADALESEGLNTVYATAEAGGSKSLTSLPAQWQVTIRPGVFTEKGLVVGKVFYDDDRNTFQDEGENGLKDIELWMEDGTRVITGDNGKFSLPEVKPGQHVLRVNELTLPKGDELLGGLNVFAKDPVTRFVQVTSSGIAKANFFVKRNLNDSLDQKVARSSQSSAIRQSFPKYIFEDTLAKFTLDTLSMYVSFTYNGDTYLQNIEVTEKLPAQFILVPNSATFNGRRVNPFPSGNSIQWKLGRGGYSFVGALKYKVVVSVMPKINTQLHSSSVITLMTQDSLFLTSEELRNETIVRDTLKNGIESSPIVTTILHPENKKLFSDSVVVSNGDEILFSTSIFVNPKKNIKNVSLFDSLESTLMINEKSFTLNGIPIPQKNISLYAVSSPLSSVLPTKNNELENLRVLNVDVTDMIRKGKNVLSYTAIVQSGIAQPMYSKMAYLKIVDNFDETKVISSKPVSITIRNRKLEILPIETSFVSKQRPEIKVEQKIEQKVEEKVEQAQKLIETLKESIGKVIVMDGIIFKINSAKLTTGSMKVLEGIAQTLIENIEMEIQINGHTDNTGNAAKNTKMSLERAKSVRTYLIKMGISEKRLFAQGFGPTQPIESNKTEEGRSKNRRVEFMRKK